MKSPTPRSNHYCFLGISPEVSHGYTGGKKHVISSNLLQMEDAKTDIHARDGGWHLQYTGWKSGPMWSGGEGVDQIPKWAAVGRWYPFLETFSLWHSAPTPIIGIHSHMHGLPVVFKRLSSPLVSIQCAILRSAHMDDSPPEGRLACWVAPCLGKPHFMILWKTTAISGTTRSPAQQVDHHGIPLPSLRTYQTNASMFFLLNAPSSWGHSLTIQQSGTPLAPQSTLATPLIPLFLINRGKKIVEQY